MTPTKRHLRCKLTGGTAPPASDLRVMSRQDLEALGALFHAAYVGTVDYEGESPEEAVAAVAATFDGEFGTFMPEASMVVERDGQLLSASFITLWQGRPLLAFAVTSPGFKGQGLSHRCTRAAMHALARAGHAELDLFVTDTNEPALALYARLGFDQASPCPPPSLPWEPAASGAAPGPGDAGA